ncbi:5-dehydro-4-deoxyglucarate dehydratase [Devosia sp. 66-22]|uniref:5-dehydro-4-deoxyglucarate dehydratase n=1 Tax=Devosia sp. 66-22 TaxID=1895753 RepID=UPI00092A084F|nr:5-dehydro-4-deoxyglucarate dehydratase [Devosia sp. 66-22]OJX52388.1 MAG: 5-dehydro-4-deoxyglucarate dehydratase [Devosia sp. 66-22]
MPHFAPAEMASAIARDLLSFPITHMKADLSFDEGPYRSHLNWIVDQAPAAVFAAGGTGEFFCLSPDEVETVVRTAVDEVKGVMPVVSAAGYGTAMAIDLAGRAERAGADGILLFPPYLVNASQAGLAAHVEAVCKATSLGVIVYNRDNAILDAETVARLCERCPNLVGLKDGVGDIELMVRTRSLLDDRLVYLGGLPTAETFARPYLTMGVATYSSALFNFMPNFARGFYNAVRADDVATIEAGLRDFILPYTAIRNRGKGYAVSIVKAGATIVGRSGGPVRPPLTELDAKSYADLDALIKAHGDVAPGSKR